MREYAIVICNEKYIFGLQQHTFILSHFGGSKIEMLADWDCPEPSLLPGLQMASYPLDVFQMAFCLHAFILVSLPILIKTRLDY